MMDRPVPENDHLGLSSGAADARIAVQAQRVAPVLWLLGKVQAGKSSIVRTLAGAAGAEIGSGFKACTETADVYDFPEQAPLIRFLDTRGLGEAGYDPVADLAVASASAHLTIAVMRAMDLDQSPVIEVLERIRRRRPDWPILVAQTHLHEAYPRGTGHPQPYPFTTTDDIVAAASPSAGCVPNALVVALAAQRALLARLPGNGPLTLVPIDFTRPEDGLPPTDYGLEAFEAALQEIAPAALAAALDDVAAARGHGTRPDCHALIVGHAVAASAADLVPVAAVAAVPAVQARLLQVIAGRHGIVWTRGIALEFAAALGTGLVARYAAAFGIRQLTKLIPAYGQTVGAAAAAATSFATTYALGKAAEVFIERRRRGERDASGVREVFARELAAAFKDARSRGRDRTGREAT